MAKHFGCCRWVYNWALAKKIEAWKTKGTSISRYALSAMLPILKKSPDAAWLSEVSAQSLQQELVCLESAYTAFFRGTSAFPKFKNKKGRQRFLCAQKVRVSFDENVVRLPKIGPVKAALSRLFDAKIKTVTVIREATGKYYAVIVVDDGTPAVPVKSFSAESTVGIDLGLKHFATLSTGEKVDNPRFLKVSLRKLVREQQKLDRKEKGSKNREKQRVRLALVHEKIRNQRRDFLHKLSTRIIRENQAVALETLNVAGMRKLKSLSRPIHDAGWGEFVRQLEYKSKWYGITVLRIGMFEPSSRLCTCGVVNRHLAVRVREWTCQHCGATHDRDVLAANNIKEMALSQLGRGTPEVTLVER